LLFCSRLNGKANTLVAHGESSGVPGTPLLIDFENRCRSTATQEARPVRASVSGGTRNPGLRFTPPLVGGTGLARWRPVPRPGWAVASIAGRGSARKGRPPDRGKPWQGRPCPPNAYLRSPLPALVMVTWPPYRGLPATATNAAAHPGLRAPRSTLPPPRATPPAPRSPLPAPRFPLHASRSPLRHPNNMLKSR
jgi:hypothetical protein